MIRRRRRFPSSRWGRVVWVLLLSACVEGRGAAEQTPVLDTAAAPAPTDLTKDSAFARTIEWLSEPGGYFDTDNLISNETSYLHVIGKMESMGLKGGAYLGVGPDQNFSYIGHLRPRVALIIDIRRDNLLQHLMFKALFAHARNRMEYLALLFGVPVGDAVEGGNDASVQELADFVDRAPRRAEIRKTAQDLVAATVTTFGVPLSEGDIITIRRFHRSFIEAGLNLRFHSLGRAPRPYYPTYRQLLLERDLSGRQSSYLADEQDFQYVRMLQERNLVIPVVGDLAGPQAMTNIGRFLTARGESLTGFYTSNVEFYLMRSGRFPQFVRNLDQLPRVEDGVIIRSYFGGFHPNSVPGYYSTQLLQTIESLVTEFEGGGYRTYRDLVTKHVLDLR